MGLRRDAQSVGEKFLMENWVWIGLAWILWLLLIIADIRKDLNR